MVQTLGILAGVGHLPVEVAKGARAEGYRVVAVGVVPGIDTELASVADVYLGTHIGKIGKIIDFLKDNKVTRVTMIGKVTKEILYSAGAIVPDWQAIKLLSSLPNRNDDTIMNALVAKLRSEGMEAMNQTLFLSHLMPAPGVFTRCQPTAEELADVEYGFAMAKEIGRLDIGQTVVVKHKAIIAVEAIEGTDACIVRSGLLSKDNIVAKTAKPQQDNRFDMPAVGLKTIQSMVQAGAKGIVMEAGRTLLVEKEQALALAEQHNIFVMAK
ncbi:MAG: UDP-2,3-diacylglucosamine diphosphatase LpxI [Acidaminococcaceae bacterium]|nr:UDP-2,3-diacylglucosamine diphosphatase LpxI [Acidaminococcaceae bacterium]